MSDISDLAKMDSSQLAQVQDGTDTQSHPAEGEIIPATPAAPPPASPTWAESQQQPLQLQQGAQPSATPGAPASPSAQPASPTDVIQPPQPMQLPQAVPQAQPVAPGAPLGAPASTQFPQPQPIAKLTPQETAKASGDMRRELADLHFKQQGGADLPSALEDFLLGAHHGAVTVGAEGKSLVDYLTGHITNKPDDWQNQAEQGIPQEVQNSLGYKAGDVLGQMGTYGVGAGAVAAALPVEALTGPAALGAMGLEGAYLGTTGAIHGASKEGKEPSLQDIAAGAALGAAGGPLIQAVGGPIARALIKRIPWLNKLEEAAQTELIKHEQMSLKAANDALAEGTAPATAIAKKQVEQAAKPRVTMTREHAKTGLFYGTEPQGQIRGRVKGRGYQRAYDGVPLEKLLPKLPEELRTPLKAAVEEIGETAAAVQHLKNQVAAYAENAIKLAQTPADARRVVRETKEGLTTQAGATLSKVRAYLFEQQRKLNKMTSPLSDLEISAHKHLNVTADRTALQTRLEPLKDTFVAAAKQAEEAERLLLNAQKHLETLREKHQPLFEQMDAHLGKPTAIRNVVGNEKFGPSQTHMTVQLQYNPSRAQLTGRWLQRYKEIERGIKAVERNIKEKVVYNVAHTGRVTAPGAARLLRASGIIHPTTKGILLAGALGINAFQGPPAHAAGMDDADTADQKIPAQAFLPAALVGVILARKYGPAGARQIARSSRFIFHFLYEDTQGLAGMADQMLANFRGSGPIHELDSLAAAMQEYRGKLMQMQFVCPDAHGIMARALIGQATPEELALLTPQAHRFLGEVEDMKSALRTFVHGYVQEFDEGYKALSTSDQLGSSEIRHAVHMINDAFNGGTQTRGGGDILLQQMFAKSAAYNFTLNWKIATTAWLHDMAAYGGMQLGVPSVYAAYAQYTGSPILRRLVSRMHLGGAASEAAQELKPAAPVYTVEAIHNQLAFLGSLNRQFQSLAPEQIKHLGIVSANDFAEKVMTMRLPDEHLARIYEEAALDVSRATGADVARLNKLGTERAFLLGNITKYTRYIMLDQRLVKTNIQAAVQYFSEGKSALGWQRLGRLGHALAIKAQYGGVKAAMPVTLYGALVSSPYTSAAMAEVAKKIDDLSLGLSVFGDLGEHGRWDPLIAPFMGQRLPGFDDGIEAFKQIMTLGADTTKMQQILASGDPTALVAGSKTDKDVKQGQAALVGIINLVGFLVPKIAGIPTRFFRDAVKAAPDIANKEFNIGVPSPWPIGEKTKPAAPAKLMQYEAQEGQTQADVDAEATIDAILEVAGRKPGHRSRAFAQATYAKNAASKAGVDLPETTPEEAGALSEK